MNIIEVKKTKFEIFKSAYKESISDSLQNSSIFYLFFAYFNIILLAIILGIGHKNILVSFATLGSFTLLLLVTIFFVIPMGEALETVC